MKRLPLPLEVGVVIVTALAMLYHNYLVFMFVPNQETMGAVQRIFYFHVGSAVAAYCSIAIVLVASLTYLSNRSETADAVAHAAGEVGFMLCTVVLASGMIWGRAAWNAWFVWQEPRLVTFLLVWLVFLAFNVLRVFGNQAKVAAHSAVLGIVGAITVPIMVYSIELLPESKQLHPQVVTRGELESSMKYALFVSMFVIVILQCILVWVRTRIELVNRALRVV